MNISRYGRTNRPTTTPATRRMNITLFGVTSTGAHVAIVLDASGYLQTALS